MCQFTVTNKCGTLKSVFLLLRCHMISVGKVHSPTQILVKPEKEFEQRICSLRVTIMPKSFKLIIAPPRKFLDLAF